MARPLAFDPATVTDHALSAFWRLGYDGCAISDLTLACGINRQSLYNHFTDKRGAFRAALARYSDLLDLALVPLSQPGARLHDLTAFIRQTLALQQTMDTGACLLVITAFSPQISDPEIRQTVEDGARRTRAAFQTVLARAGTPDPEAAAAYLYAVMTGLSALSRTGGAAAIDAAIQLALETLTPKDPRP